MLGVGKQDSAETLFYVAWRASELQQGKDKVFFLSAREVYDYIGNYEPAAGFIAYTDSSEHTAKAWMLRTPWDRANLQGVYSHIGMMGDGYVGYSIVNELYDAKARPAVNIDANAVLLTSAAEGGKNGGAVGPNALTSVKTMGMLDGYDGNDSDWKLTLLDSGRNFTARTTAVQENLLTITYSDAATGANEYISAIVVDGQNAVSHYGKVAQAAEANGTAEIDLTGIDMTGSKLYVFNEQDNGNRKTDYSSALCEVTLTVQQEQAPIVPVPLIPQVNVPAYRLPEYIEAEEEIEDAPDVEEGVPDAELR